MGVQNVPRWCPLAVRPHTRLPRCAACREACGGVCNIPHTRLPGWAACSEACGGVVTVLDHLGLGTGQRMRDGVKARVVPSPTHVRPHLVSVRQVVPAGRKRKRARDHLGCGRRHRRCRAGAVAIRALGGSR
eukprot:363805-Chlamydomonas_euryale.AAC.7